MRTAIILLFTCVFISVAETGHSQNAKVSLNKNNVNLKEVLNEIENQTEYLFIYNNEVNTNKTVSVKTKNEAVRKVLTHVLKDSDIDFLMEGNHIILSYIEEKLREKNEEVVEAVQQEGKTITGRVTDTYEEPLPGVTVVVKGTIRGTTTDIDGNFTLTDISESGILQFSYVGMLTQEIAVGSRTKVDITMLEDAIGLEEVVAVGYGTMKKSDLTGSVISISSDKINERPVVNVGQALSGLAAGVEVFESSGTPDGNVRIRIRGDNSITSSNDPLYVVDGVIGVSNINLFNPSEIESLEVLKDASATAIYGARGANGVIIITTKRGVKGEEPVISYNGYVSVGVLSNKVDLMNAEEWWETYNLSMDNGAKYDPIGFAQGVHKKADPTTMPNLFDANGKPLYDTDWQKEAYPPSFSNNHQLSIRGGTGRSAYSAHLSYMHRDNLAMKNDYLKRYTGRLNIDTELKSWLNFGANLYFSNSKGNDNSATYGIKRLVQEAIPIIPVKYPDGKWGSNRDFPGAVQDTPGRYLEEYINETTNTQVLGDFYFELKFTKDLSLKSTFAVDMNDRKYNSYVGREFIQFGGKNNNGIARIQTSKQIYWQNENYINWDKEFNNNNRMNFMGGISWQQRSSENLNSEARDFSDDFYQWHNLGAGTVPMPSSSSDWRWSLNSYFARFNYTLYNRYLFTATGRVDGSSKFGKNNRYAFFPSFAFAWRASEESFLKDNELIDNLKIRTSVGETGNQEIGNYTYLQNLGSNNVIFGNEYYSALYRSTFGNPNLKWEKTLQMDIGFDLSILSQRINLAADYYYKKHLICY